MPSTSLHEELEASLLEMAALPLAPIHPDDIGRPSDDAIQKVRTAAESLIASPVCKLHRLNISPGHNDEVLFSLIGSGGRDCDLWINSTDDPGHLGEAHFVAGTKTEQYEGYLPYDRCGELLPWLFGEGPLP
jgi:hypothetical protein